MMMAAVDGRQLPEEIAVGEEGSPQQEQRVVNQVEKDCTPSRSHAVYDDSSERPHSKPECSRDSTDDEEKEEEEEEKSSGHANSTDLRSSALTVVSDSAQVHAEMLRIEDTLKDFAQRLYSLRTISPLALFCGSWD